MTSGDIYDAYKNGQGNGNTGRATLQQMTDIPESVRRLFSPTFVAAANQGNTPILARDGLYAVNYTDLSVPKVPLLNLTNLMPVTAAGYTFQAPPEWGKRIATGELQTHINQMIQQEAQIAIAIGAWDSLQGDILRTLRLINAKLDTAANIRLSNEVFSRVKVITLSLLNGISGVIEALNATEETVTKTFDAGRTMVPTGLPTAGLAFSPGDGCCRDGRYFRDGGRFQNRGPCCGKRSGNRAE